MAGYSNKIESDSLNWVMAQATLPQIPRIWMSLHSANPSDTGANEISTGMGYARKEVTGYFLPTSSDKISNTQEVNFIAATSQYSATHFGIWGISSEGDGSLFYLSGPLNAGSDAVVIQVGKTPSFPVGSITVSID